MVDLYTLLVSKLEYIFFLHLFLSLIFTSIASYRLKDTFRTSPVKTFLFMLVFNLALPIMGYGFSLWIVYMFKTVTYKEELKDTNMLNLEEFDNSFVKIHRVFGEGSMLEMMENDNVPSHLKLKALVSMADNVSQQNIEIIKQTLSSEDDEIRLFSFAIINRLEYGINAEVSLNLKKYKAAQTQEEKSLYAKALAELYWELIYYELSEDSLKEYLLDEVIRYINIAFIHFTHEVSLHKLLGRVCMLKGENEKAITEFTFALEVQQEEDSMEDTKILPYLVELYFMEENYAVVKSILEHSKNLEFNATLYPIIEQWREKVA